MLRIFFILTTLLLGLLPFTVDAACNPGTGAPAAEFLRDCASGVTNSVSVAGTESKEGIKALVITIARTVLQFGALFAIGAIVYSGIRYASSAGDEEKIKSAKNTLMYSVIGLVLLLTAFPLVNIIVEFIYSFGQ